MTWMDTGGQLFYLDGHHLSHNFLHNNTKLLIGSALSTWMQGGWSGLPVHHLPHPRPPLGMPLMPWDLALQNWNVLLRQCYCCPAPSVSGWCAIHILQAYDWSRDICSRTCRQTCCQIWSVWPRLCSWQYHLTRYVNQEARIVQIYQVCRLGNS